MSTRTTLQFQRCIQSRFTQFTLDHTITITRTQAQISMSRGPLLFFNSEKNTFKVHPCFCALRGVWLGLRFLNSNPKMQRASHWANVNKQHWQLWTSNVDRSNDSSWLQELIKHLNTCTIWFAANSRAKTKYSMWCKVQLVYIAPQSLLHDTEAFLIGAHLNRQERTAG